MIYVEAKFGSSVDTVRHYQVAVSDEGVYIIVARPKAICYGRTFAVNGRAFTLRHLVDCVTFASGADFGRLQPAKQQCGCHGLKRRHSDLFPPTRLECCHVLKSAPLSALSYGLRSTITHGILRKAQDSCIFRGGLL